MYAFCNDWYVQTCCVLSYIYSTLPLFCCLLQTLLLHAEADEDERREEELMACLGSNKGDVVGTVTQ